MANYDRKKIRLIVLFVLLVCLGVGFGTGCRSCDCNQQKVKRTPAAPQAMPVDMKVLAAGAAVKGEDQAPLTLVWFNSFSCGFCNRYAGTIKKMQSKYPGKVKVAMLHFQRGKMDAVSAQLSECARDQGKFWEAVDVLFETRGKATSAQLSDRISGLNKIEMKKCLTSGKYKNRIDAHTRRGRELNVRGTPSTFAAGLKVTGARRLDYFEKYFAAYLE